MKKLAIAVALALVIPFAGLAHATDVTVDPTKITVGYMNVFDLGLVYQWGSGWGFAALPAFYTGSDLTLAPNSIDDPAPYWYLPGGGPGSVGQKIMEASMVRTPSFWALLMRAFPRQYKPLMKAAEETYQQDMIQYGGLLLADEETIMAVVAQQMAEFSIQYLAYQMGVPPEAFEPFRPQLVNLSALAMDIGVGICASPEAGYMKEVNATAAYVAGQLQARNITSKLLR